MNMATPSSRVQSRTSRTPHAIMARMPRTIGRLTRSLPTAPAQDAAGLGTRVLAVPQHLLSVHEHVANAGGVLVRLVEGGMVLNGRRIEDHDIGEAAWSQPAAPR